jgi:hypothetical protein
MTAVAPALVAELLGIVAAYLALVDLVKVRLFRVLAFG